MLNLVDHENVGLTPLIEKVIEAAFKELKLPKDDVLNLILINDEKMKAFNLQFAGKEATTDVLSFPSGLEGELGDIFISIDKAKVQALEYGHSLEREIGFLMVHGLLHCVGYTHETEEDLEKMIELQETILTSVDLKRSL